jgi:3-isopropylmalate/(R)-2-methylmalate dehydratase small subunit
MIPFVTLDAVAAPLDIANCNTDQILPARFLKKPRAGGYGQFLFHDLRFAADGAPRPGFVLDRPGYAGAAILVADNNFGCGSSREGAVYALLDAGIRAVVAPGFGDIFFNNCFKNGVLPIVLPADAVARMRRLLNATPGATMFIDLPNQQAIGPDGTPHAFAVDALRKQCLIEGLDDIRLTLKHDAAIAAFETARDAELPWLR